MATPLRLRVLSLNIHKGFSHFNLVYVLDEIRRFIRETAADVVFLQEVQGFTEVSPTPSSQFEFLADTVWDHYAYGKNAVYPEGHHGNAILSKYPVEHWHNLDISTNRVEKRGVLHARIRIPDQNLFVECFSLHLNLLPASRKLQTHQYLQYMKEKLPPQNPVILAGDFNDWQKVVSPILKEKVHLLEVFETLHGTPAKTFPSFFPMMPLDRIYSRGLTLIHAERLNPPHWTKSSDHLALLAEFEWNPAGGSSP